MRSISGRTGNYFSIYSFLSDIFSQKFEIHINQLTLLQSIDETWMLRSQHGVRWVSWVLSCNSGNMVSSMVWLNDPILHGGEGPIHPLVVDHMA